MVTLRERASDLLVRHVDLLRAAVAEVKHARPFGIVAMVVMPDHLLAIWTLPPDDGEFFGRWRAIKARFVRALKRRGVALNCTARGEADVWQRRFWEHTIRDEDDLARHVDYIHYSPVKHGLVARAPDWPHFSIQSLIKHGLLTPDRGMAWPSDGQAYSGRFLRYRR